MMIIKVLKWIKNLLLRIISIPVYILLALVVLLILLLELGQTNPSTITKIIDEYRKKKNNTPTSNS